jgi:ribosomal protein S1
MEGVEGLVHVTEMSEDYNIRIEDFVTVVGLCTLESS